MRRLRFRSHQDERSYQKHRKPLEVHWLAFLEIEVRILRADADEAGVHLVDESKEAGMQSPERVLHHNESLCDLRIDNPVQRLADRSFWLPRAVSAWRLPEPNNGACAFSVHLHRDLHPLLQTQTRRLLRTLLWQVNRLFRLNIWDHSAGSSSSSHRL